MIKLSQCYIKKSVIKRVIGFTSTRYKLVYNILVKKNICLKKRLWMTTAQTAHRQILHLIQYFGTFSTKYQINTMLLALMGLSEFCYPFLDVVLFLIPCLYH